MGKVYYYNNLETPLGKIGLLISKKGIVSLNFESEKEGFLEKLKYNNSNSILIKEGLKINEPLQELNEYFRGTRKEFCYPLDLRGTPFQLKVWKALRKIPYGETVSYEYIAKMINNPRGTRAVGQAIGKNPVPIIIPCHRVINKSGRLGGYSGGLDIKKWLLAWEERNINE